jgi:diacylglycerol kinase (CTP)
MVEPALEWQDFKNRSDVHWARKIWHMATVFFIFLVYQKANESLAMALLLILAGILIPLDFLRLRYPKLNDVAVIVMGPLMRNTEVRSAAGTTYLITGVVFIASIFSKPIVSLAILFLAFADPLASYIGIRYGKDKIFGNKSIQGFLMAFFVCALLAFIFLAGQDLQVSRRLVISLLSGVVGALAELVPIGKLDDNLTMPILSATGLWAVFQIFGLNNPHLALE